MLIYPIYNHNWRNISTIYIYIYIYIWSRNISVGIATRYELEGPGIESRWGEIFRTYPDRLRDPPSLLYNGYRVFPVGKGGRGVMLTTQPLLVPRLRRVELYLHSLYGSSWACYGVPFTFIYIYIYLFIYIYNKTSIKRSVLTIK
jgi:hypothetical protein